MSDGASHDVIEIDALPAVESFGSLHGRDAFRRTCRRLFADPTVRFLRDGRDRVVVFRHAHLRALAASPLAGNVPPDALAGGSYRAVADAAATPAGGGAAVVRVVANQVFSMNAPLHDPARRILATALSPKGVAAMTAMIGDVVDDLLRALCGAGTVDFQRQFADELIHRVWARLIGLDEDEQAALIPLVRRMSALFLDNPSREEIHAFDTAIAGYAAIVAGAARRSSAAGGFPLVETMARALDALRFDDDPACAGVVPKDVGDYLAGNLIDAFHTAALGVANVVYAMFTRRGVLQMLKVDDSAIPGAVAEALRLEPPVLHLNRYALDDFVFHGLRIPKGSRIVMCWGAGDLDPEAFTDPESFMLDRPARGATTFGSGAQICPGRILASRLAQQTIQALVDANIEVEIDPATTVWYERSAMAQIRTMPVRLSRPTAS